MAGCVVPCQGHNAGYMHVRVPGRRLQHKEGGNGFGMHAIIAEGIRRVDGQNTSSPAHMGKIKIGTAHRMGASMQPRLPTCRVSCAMQV